MQHSSKPTSVEITRAAQILRAGGLVAFPTETVYGLGADAASDAAVGRIFAAKGRPRHHPLIVHLAEVAALDGWAVDVPEAFFDADSGIVTLLDGSGLKVAAATYPAASDALPGWHKVA